MRLTLLSRRTPTAGLGEESCFSLLCCSKLQDDVAPCALASRVTAFPESAAAPAAAAREAAPVEVEWSAELAAFLPASVQAADW